MHFIEVNGKQVKTVFLNFQSEDRVNQLMKSRTIQLNREEYKISRFNPPDYELAGRIVYTLSVTKTDDPSNHNTITEYDLNKYFKNFGNIVDYKKQNDDEFILRFQE